ncbi:MAG: fluoride efflux transporter CrcB [Phycisphaerae bacterium]|nr:fluoride efflux transporter CrcB [Phycisphaerae bacterium]
MHKLVPLFIFVGSGVGGVMRWMVGGWVQRLSSGAFPIGTLAVNIIGCFLIGLLTVALPGRLLVREEFRIALLVGLLGGFTTFSTFGLETFALLNDGQAWRALLNVAGSVVLGLAAVWLGYRLAEGWLGV